MYYEEHIQVNTIKDTVMSVGKVTVDYGEMTSISGLPPGITYQCNPLNCRVNGGMKGCILFYGTCNTAGVYDITFTIKMSGKVWGTIPFTQNQIIKGYRIIIHGQPVADFTSNITKICPNNTVKFYEAAAGGVTAWEWDFPGGDPSSSTLKKPFIKYPQPGYYDVTLKVTSPIGTDIVTKSTYVEVGGVAASINILGNDSICQGGATDLEAPNVNNAIYQWKRNSIDINGAIGPVYSAKQGGNYSIKITDGNTGCITESPKTKITVAYPLATINAADPVNFCAGQTCLLKGTFAVGQTYQWYRKGVAITGATLKNYTATLGGNYKCLVTSALGCSAYSNAIALAIVCRDNINADSQTSNASLYANPIINQATINLNLITNDRLSIQVYSIDGKLVMDYGEMTFETGQQDLELNMNNFNDGLYLLNIRGNTKIGRAHV